MSSPALKDAFSVLCTLIEQGVMPQVVRGGIKYPAMPEALKARTLRLEPAMLELLQVGKKEWAAGRREIVMAVDPQKGFPQFAVGIEVLERKTLGHVCVSKDFEQWRRFLGDATTLIVAESSFLGRAAVGAFLAQARLGQGRLEVVEVSYVKPARAEDFRHVLAGSSWLELPLPMEKDVAARALRTALAIRSIRKDIPKSFKQGLFTALAVRAACAEGESKSQIAQRFGISEELVARWGEQKFKEEAPPRLSTPLPVEIEPSEAQRRYVRALLADLPPLQGALPEDWAFRVSVVKEFLNKAAKPAEHWRPRWRQLSQSKALRRALGEGLPWTEALNVSHVSKDSAMALLEMNLVAFEDALLQDMCQVMQHSLRV